MVQQAVPSALLGLETAEIRPAGYWRETFPPNIAIVRKTFRHPGEGMGHFFRHVGFIFGFSDVANG